MKTKSGDYEFDDDKSRLQINEIHKMLSEAYWCKGVPTATVQSAIDGSICIGVYHIQGEQVGFARVVTDGATFAWICDVIVNDKHRGQGLSKAMMDRILKHPALQGLRRICLATKDAHKLYEKFGFKVTESPQNWMEIKNNEVYLR